ncbi:MAG: hypothetical protein RIC56_22900 [Pseudomonadales bacterium]
MAAWLGCCSAAAEETVRADDGAPVDYVQAWVGALDTDDAWTLDRSVPDDDLVGGLGTLPFGGGAAQRLWGQGFLRMGYEGGGLVSWKNDDTRFFAASDGGGGTIAVTTENRFFSIGVFMGGVASFQLAERLRVQVAAGPSLSWARLAPDDDAPDSTAVGPKASDDVSLVPYGRLGVEVLLGQDLMLGASMRYADDDFDFGRNGKFEMDEVMWLLTLGSRL